MARALALARFSPDAAQSASLFLRAGQSAAAQHDVAQARIWLAKAHAAADPALRAEAGLALASLSTIHADANGRTD